MRTPNNEQRKAIEHSGGVLLSAGAGSGKTFVLIEHIIHLVKEFDHSHRFIDENDCRRQVSEYLSSIVLMTFTKKAAGELLSRLKARLKEENGQIWDIVQENLSRMLVSTIHGFCHRLLSGGYFPEIGGNIDIITDAEAKHRIEKLLSQYTEFHPHDILIRNYGSILNSMLSIFSSPELRLMWEEYSLETLVNIDEKEIWNEILAFNDIKTEYFGEIDLDYYSDYKEKSWWKCLNELYSNILDKSIEVQTEFFSNTRIAGPVGKAKADLPEIVSIFGILKKYKEITKKYGNDFISFKESKHDEFYKWGAIIKETFDYVNSQVNKEAGVTFSDLEYLVAKGLRDEESCSRVRDNYKYFIVDEFQDTSEIQFEILHKVSGSEEKRIFCVGDVKQAIYGFRGGELSVFSKCSEFVSQNLSMKNNYRSAEGVIDFNNQVFDHLFKIGIGFEGLEINPVPVDFQTFPDHLEKKVESQISEVIITLEDIETNEKGKLPKITSGELASAEAQATISKLRQLAKAGESDTCVLFKGLKPSLNLISLLIKNDMSFSAQVKVPFGEDPIAGIFSIIIKTLFFAREHKDNSPLVFLLNGYLKYLNFDIEMAILDESVELFLKEHKILGLEYSYKKLLSKLGINNSNYQNNYSLIDSILKVSREDLDQLYSFIKQNEESAYSIEFQYGDTPKKIVIMTCHASKGLEFSTVILGSVSSNGRKPPEIGFMGKLPGSFKWKIKDDLSRNICSPLYAKEKFINLKKNFSESKRLFYVACTRAKNNIVWFSFISNDGQAISVSDNSWIKGFHSFKNISEHDYQTESYKVSIKNNSEGQIKTPLFHRDNIGISNGTKLDLGLISELSVTSLICINECPYKFYLRNICKIEDDSLKDLDAEANIEYSEDDISSKKRGTRIHSKIHELITRKNWKVGKEDDDQCVMWVEKELSKLNYKETEIYSEQLIKFSLFGHMITAIPDLIINLEGKSLIWDYKTGSIKENGLLQYQMQLLCYALAGYESGIIHKLNKVELSVVYLDVREKKTIELDYNTCIKKVFELWKKTSELEKKNFDHCASCSYNGICDC